MEGGQGGLSNTDVIRATAGVANIREKIRDVRLRWLGRVERNLVMRRWKWVDTER